MGKHKQSILKLRSQGKTYNQIADLLQCSKGTIAYHCGKNQKQKYNARRKKHRAQHPFINKIETFKYTKYTKPITKNIFKTNIQLLQIKLRTFHTNRKDDTVSKYNFSLDDIINKFGENPKCYLTGEPIDINKPRTYQFDHIIPVSRGGDNSLDNLQICTKQANNAKRDMTPDELFFFCKKVLENNNYTVTKNK